MSDDKESFPSLSTLDTAEPRGYAQSQLVNCDSCRRNNPPTRSNCLYCGAKLPASEATADLRKPTLRQLEKWEHGYNNIVVPRAANVTTELSSEAATKAADLVKLTPDELMQITSARAALPVSRTASSEDAELVKRRLSALGIDTMIVADADLESNIVRTRAIDIADEFLSVYERPEIDPIQLRWTDLCLFVTGRLIIKRVDVTEQPARTENKLVDASEFFTDEQTLTFFRRNDKSTYRINGNSFDFSILGDRKKLVVAENMATLMELLRLHAPHAEWDNSYNHVRKLLDAVWAAEQQNQTTGLRHDRPGKRVIASTAETSNEAQFLKYSRLVYHLRFEQHTTDENA